MPCLCDAHVDHDTNQLVFEVLIRDGLRVLLFVRGLLFSRRLILLVGPCLDHLRILVSLFLLLGVFAPALFILGVTLLTGWLLVTRFCGTGCCLCLLLLLEGVL
jgi:hypothetical protein